MSATNNGGPAFPATSWSKDGDFLGENQGMTLRDYFAVHATDTDIAAQINVLRYAQQKKTGSGILPDDYMVICRYMHADAMLRAREAA